MMNKEVLKEALNIAKVNFFRRGVISVELGEDCILVRVKDNHTYNLISDNIAILVSVKIEIVKEV